MAKIGFIVSFLGKALSNILKPDRKKRMKTSPIWEPTTSNLIGDILDRYQIHQNERIQKIEVLKEVIEKSNYSET